MKFLKDAVNFDHVMKEDVTEKLRVFNLNDVFRVYK